jgi:hypothetical protein
MQNLKEVRKSFETFRSSTKNKESSGITPDLLFEDSMVSGVLDQLLGEMKVTVNIEAAFGDASNIPQADTTNAEQKLKLEREEFNI